MDDQRITQALGGAAMLLLLGLLWFGYTSYDQMSEARRDTVEYGKDLKVPDGVTLDPVFTTEDEWTAWYNAEHSMPEIRLQTGKGHGTYKVGAFVNPGTPGTASLAVYEINKQTPIPIQALPETWKNAPQSDNPSVLFAYTAQIIVRKGSPRWKYPVRIEVRFKPVEGTERTLVGGNFLVSGANQ